MRLIDAELIEKYIEDGLNEKDPKKRFGHDAIEIMTEIHYAPTIVLQSNDQPSNAPLTLDELREMDGEPVWTEAIDGGVSRWTFVDVDCELVRFFKTRRGVVCEVIARHFKTYGKTWLAYRRRPEEASRMKHVCAATGGSCCWCNPGPCNSRRPEGGNSNA